MTVKLYAFTCGTVTGEFAHLMEGGEGDITVPIPVFLIEHPNGRALFDTGLSRTDVRRHSVADRPPAGTAHVGMTSAGPSDTGQSGAFQRWGGQSPASISLCSWPGELPVAQVVQRRDPGLETAESPANVGSN
jgi:hypothetical protein